MTHPNDRTRKSKVIFFAFLTTILSLSVYLGILASFEIRNIFTDRELYKYDVPGDIVNTARQWDLYHSSKDAISIAEDGEWQDEPEIEYANDLEDLVPSYHTKLPYNEVENETVPDVKQEGPQTPQPRKIMMILDWNHIKGQPHSLRYNFSGCEYSECTFTLNPWEADLVMLNGARLKRDPLPPRYKDQIWMLYTKEPPTFHRFDHLAREDLTNQINWTRCIFGDSTFKSHYAAVEERDPPNKDYDAIFKQKRFAAAWFASHCPTQSRREEYIERMTSSVDVHKFGICGNMSCGRHGLKLLDKRDQCLDMLSHDYKFYLGFENSFCTDYVTEKFYKVFDETDIIPVVRGAAAYKKIISPQAFVDAKDFSSPEALGRYLRALANNKEKYIHMLRMKNRYTLAYPKPYFPCVLCKALHTRRHIPSVYEDILGWLKGHCWLPDDL